MVRNNCFWCPCALYYLAIVEIVHSSSNQDAYSVENQAEISFIKEKKIIQNDKKAD